MLFCFQILQTNHKISGIGAEFNILYLHSWLNLFLFFFFSLLFFPPSHASSNLHSYLSDLFLKWWNNIPYSASNMKMTAESKV